MLCIFNGIFHEKSNVFAFLKQPKEFVTKKKKRKVKLERNKQQQQKLIIID